LALSSGLFLLLASLTGIILAFEPISDSLQNYKPRDISNISLAETVEALYQSYDDVLTLEVDANEFVIADVITKQGDNTSIYIDPKTGKELGKPEAQHPVFQFTTNLHRSLFLKSIGRFFVGLVSFLLCLIAVTGFLLLIKRLGGVRKLFSKVQKDYFELRYHVVLGRWFLIPILIIAVTGVYLSAEKFGLLPSTKVVHRSIELSEDADFTVKHHELSPLKEITLQEVKKVNFPFSEFPEDYFEIALDDREIYIHQYTGEILSEEVYPFSALASNWSLLLHTGQGSITWSIILLLASCSLVFFMYSGFVMWRRRMRNAKKTSVNRNKEECTHIILVGSETGNTFSFASALEKALSTLGKSVFVAQMNDYDTYPRAEHLIVLTATYGDGEAPTNAKNFKKSVQSFSVEKPMYYSVVGFGSLIYPAYCQYAIEVDTLLQKTPGFSKAISLYKINNQSFEAFADWSTKWGYASKTPIVLQQKKKKTKPPKLHSFRVVQKTELNTDDTFLIRLANAKGKLKVYSGDLWGYAPDDGILRWYSIAKINNELVLSIKKHEFGTVSTILSNSQVNQSLKGSIRRNYSFNFPKNAPALVCISNGTGIAPFLGILNENINNIPIDLYWGGRTQQSLHIYKESLEKARVSKKLNKLYMAFSQEDGNKQYVQDLLRKRPNEIAESLRNGTVFMICGSFSMQNEVLNSLAEISESILSKPLSEFENKEQLLFDCY
jgi:sulfite reductase (NADPH) flavoprotein alpha-component